jgi:hypothetical protein
MPANISIAAQPVSAASSAGAAAWQHGSRFKLVAPSPYRPTQPESIHAVAAATTFVPTSAAGNLTPIFAKTPPQSMHVQRPPSPIAGHVTRQTSAPPAIQATITPSVLFGASEVPDSPHRLGSPTRRRFEGRISHTRLNYECHEVQKEKFSL